MGSPTILLVHGAWHGSWCWADIVAQLEADGFETVAVDLPGHNAPGSSARKWNTLASYVDHVHSAIDAIDGEVVLVGHSMGGLVTQRVLETRSVASAVLVASAPLKGVFGVVTRLVRHTPRQFFATLSLTMWPLVSSEERVRQHFFTPDTPEAVVSHTASMMQNESYPAFLSMLTRWPRPSRVARWSTPISVVAAQHDTIFTLDEQRNLADVYGAPITVIDSGHDIMLDAQWPQLTDHITSIITPVDPESAPRSTPE